MQKEEIRKNLIGAAKQLLLETQPIDRITSRQISAKAGTNLAMINYCFSSKDALIKAAVDEIIMEEAGNPMHLSATDAPPLKRLWDMLWGLCRLVIRFGAITRAAVPYILLESKIEAPAYILPILDEYYGDSKTQTECRIIGYELISFMQLIFYRAQEVSRYCGCDILDEDNAKMLLKMQFKLFFEDGEYDE
jgi:Transcriptional regulator